MAHVLQITYAISRCYSFPPHLTTAFALPEKMQQFRNSIISLKCCIIALPVKQSLLSFFKLVDSRLILVLSYDSLNLIIIGVYQSHLGCFGHRSEKVKLRGLNNVTCRMCQCAVLLTDKLLSAACFLAINILLRW